MTNIRKQIDLLDKAIRQTRWAMANTSIALWCAILAFFVMLAGYILAGVLIIAISLVAYFNGRYHDKNG